MMYIVGTEKEKKKNMFIHVIIKEQTNNTGCQSIMYSKYELNIHAKLSISVEHLLYCFTIYPFPFQKYTLLL